MNNWQNVKLSDVADIIGGGTPKTSIKEYWGGNIPWLSVVDFNDNSRYVYKTEKSITKKGVENSSTNILNIGDLIISARGTVGALAQLASQMAFNQSCYGLRAKPNSTEDFLYYLIKYQVENIKRNTHGSVFDTITIDTFEKIEILLPILPEQVAIAGILSSLDDKIEANRKQNETLEAMAAAIFKSWFVDFEPFSGKMPNDWNVGKLSDISEVTTGKRPNYKETEKSDKYNIPVYGGNGIAWYTNEILVKESVILTGRVGTLGSFYRVYDPVWVSDNALIMSPIDNFFEYVYFVLLQANITSFNRGSTQPLLTQTDIKNIDVIIPNNQEIKKFSGTISVIFNKIRFNEKQSDTLAQIRDSLLPRLMSGHIRVPDAEKIIDKVL